MVEAKDENQLPAAAFTTGGDDGTSIRTLMLTDIVDSTVLLDRVGDARAAEIFGRHDVVFRELLQAHEGREIDKTDGFLLLFRRPFEAVRYAVAYQDALIELSEELGFELKARAGIHLGEVVLRENPPAHVARGAKPVEVEGLAKHAAADDRAEVLALGVAPAELAQPKLGGAAQPRLEGAQVEPLHLP